MPGQFQHWPHRKGEYVDVLDGTCIDINTTSVKYNFNVPYHDLTPYELRDQFSNMEITNIGSIPLTSLHQVNAHPVYAFL
jgi:hypothetical protein